MPIGTWKSPLSGHCEDGQAGSSMLRLESIVETFINIHDCISATVQKLQYVMSFYNHEKLYMYVGGP